MSGLGFSILLRHEKSDRTHKDTDLLFVHILQLPENPLSSSEGGMPSTALSVSAKVRERHCNGTGVAVERN